MKDGRPQVSPVWIDIEDNDSIILINTTQGRLNIKMYQEIPEYLYQLLIE